MNKPGIAVTGMGVISAIGDDVTATLQSLRSGRTGIGAPEVIRLPWSDIPVGEVRHDNATLAAMAGVDAEENLSRTSLLGLIAARQAVAQAFGGKLPERAAFISGTTVGGMDRAEAGFIDYYNGNSEAAPDGHDCGTSTQEIASHLGTFRFTTTLSTACSSAANAIVTGARLLELGMVDVVVAGGTEALSLFHIGGFKSLMIVDSEPCRPFDNSRAGLNLGEGAAFVVLQRADDATAPLAYLAGYGNCCDAFHQTASSPEGDGSAMAMEAALAMAGMHPRHIGYINAHGTSTPNNDASEAEAIRRVFAGSIPVVTSTKSYTGHTTSASGAIESVISILCLANGFIPANLRLANPLAHDIPLPTATTPLAADSAVMCNSFGFGGNDTSLIFTRP